LAALGTFYFGPTRGGTVVGFPRGRGRGAGKFSILDGLAPALRFDTGGRGCVWEGNWGPVGRLTKKMEKKRRSVRAAVRRKSTAPVLAIGEPVDLVVLSVRPRASYCHLPGDDQVLLLRADRPWELVPGEIATVKPAKQWIYGGTPYVSGVLASTRLEAKALGLAPLGLAEVGIWRPTEHDWRETGAPLEDWERAILAWGPRAEFEMEQVLPGFDGADPFSDPIGRSVDLQDAGDPAGAHEVLMELCRADLRCLDAHAHLGNLAFRYRPGDAVRHYAVGYRIGELSLGDGFDGLLPWGWIDNRPFLRCLHGYGLCLWRLGRFEEAAAILLRMLWLNPRDNQGVRFILKEVEAKAPWRDE
jgi:hypothetical protein